MRNSGVWDLKGSQVPPLGIGFVPLGVRHEDFCFAWRYELVLMARLAQAAVRCAQPASSVSHECLRSQRYAHLFLQ